MIHSNMHLRDITNVPSSLIDAAHTIAEADLADRTKQDKVGHKTD